MAHAAVSTAGAPVHAVHDCGLQPDLYQSGAAAMEMGCEAGPSMSPECASVKLMQHLKYRDLPLGVPLAGEC